MGLIPGLGKSPRGGNDHPFWYSCLEKFHGQRSLESYSPWSCKDSDLTEYEGLQLSSVQSFSCVQLFVIPWTAACQASLSITNSRSLLRFMSIELVMPSNNLILCRPLLLLPSIFPSISVFSNESVLCRP